MIVLPPKYYLSHFFEFIEFIEAHYRPVLESEHLLFLSEFRDLSEDAKCAYIRMINRKGRIFERSGFLKYVEIQNLQQGLNELQSKKFSRFVTEKEIAELLEFLPKPRLQNWLAQHGLVVSSSLSRNEIVEIGKQNRHRLNYERLVGHENLIVQLRSEPMQYLLFLYFGHIQKSLTLYALRDLGLRQSNTLKAEFRPRFETKQQALEDYFFATQLEANFEDYSPEALQNLLTQIEGYNQLSGSTLILKDQLSFRLAEHLLQSDENLALRAYARSGHVSARPRKARLLYKMNLRDECFALLEEIQLEPRNDEELLFAEDFSARKFNRKKLGRLSEVLQNAPEITISDFYLKRPEAGVIAWYRSQDVHAEFTENFLWTRLFGLLFWDELFESSEAAIHNPFERSPSDLLGPDFYRRNEQVLEQKLATLRHPSEIKNTLLRTITQNYGRLNDVFQWHESLAADTISFVEKTHAQDLGLVLRTLAQKYSTHHVGFPDLMTEKDGVIRFVEVKAEGDVLRASQLSRMQLLKEAGFEVEVLRVRWTTDPHQVYVVVDVETTGGSSPFHRVTEVGAVKVQNGKIIDEFQTLINPGRPIPSFIAGITGITNQMVADAPRFSEIAEAFFEFIKGAVFVAHNVKFDYGFIQREFAKAGIEFVRPHLCTCAGMRRTHPGLTSYGLKNLAAHFQIRLDQHHRALSDARTAAELLLLMNEKRSHEGLTVHPE